MESNPPAGDTPTMSPLGRFASLLAGAILLAGALAIWWQCRPAPVAYVLLNVAMRSPTGMDSPDNPRAVAARRTQEALIQSDAVVAAALRDPRVAGLTILRAPAAPVAWVQARLQTDFAIDPEILRLRMTGPDRAELEECAVLLDAIVRAYLDAIVGEENRARAARLARLQAVQADAERNVLAMRQTLDRSDAALPRRDELRADLASAEDLLKRISSEVQLLQIELQAPERITVLQPAIVHVPPPPGLRPVLAFFAGLRRAG